MLISTRLDCMARRLDSGDSAQRFANNHISPRRSGALLAACSLLSTVSVERVLLPSPANDMQAVCLPRWIDGTGLEKEGDLLSHIRLPASRSADLPFAVWSSGIGVCLYDALSFCMSDGARRASSLGLSSTHSGRGRRDRGRSRRWGQDEGSPCLLCAHMTCSASFSARCAVPQYVPGTSQADKLGLMLWVGL